MQSAHSINQHHGYTLLELLVVLAIAALTLTLVGANITSAVGSANLKSDVRKIASSLRSVRSESLTTSSIAAFHVAPDGTRYRLEPMDKEVYVSDGITLDLRADQHPGELQLPSSAILFYPDGTSNGGEITVTSESQQISIEVLWLTGEVKIHE
ncbi:GspH/FimT family pseudopilin [Porticoccaceae bacterium LTM1]|nr:GspH/FimT family pseudopilin [Porticoccaceae bacterium LTM1]